MVERIKPYNKYASSGSSGGEWGSGEIVTISGGVITVENGIKLKQRD